jgi:hypothetical protein
MLACGLLAPALPGLLESGFQVSMTLWDRTTYHALQTDIPYHIYLLSQRCSTQNRDLRWRAELVSGFSIDKQAMCGVDTEAR